MTLSEELSWRGFVNQTTYDDLSAIDGDPIAFYWGVDPSAHSMTIGNLAAAMMVRHFIDYGHKAYLLVGGATGMIGDPDGKKQERDLLTPDQIDSNKAAIAEQYKTAFAGKDFEIVDNYDWFKDMRYLDFLRDIGKHVSMTQMLNRDFVQSRIGESGDGISYAEFSYSLIQGYDFLHLHREKGVSLQLAGADQWGNSVTGVQLIRRLEGKEAHVFTAPLIVNKQTGVKFGKSEGGAIWLDPQLTSVYKFYQFWLNVDDEGVIDYMKIYTLLPREEIEAIAENHKANPEARSAQKRLAQEVTTLVHGKERYESVMRVTEVLFGGADFSSLSPADIEALALEIPAVGRGKTIIEVLVESGTSASNGEARRLLDGGAISLNGQKVTDDQAIETAALLKKGKNTFVLVR
ncbi:MAG: tyrS [Candidatus Saccharibacteria bacterium]|nr:tyrS [Candidatus Saccharibacteria bacterium]